MPYISSYLGSCVTINLHAFEISYHRSHFGAERTLEIFKRHLKSHFTCILKYFCMLHLTNTKSKNKINVTYFGYFKSVVRSGANVLLGEKD